MEISIGELAVLYSLHGGVDPRARAIAVKVADEANFKNLGGLLSNAADATQELIDELAE